jgi:hypothetical protein
MPDWARSPLVQNARTSWRCSVDSSQKWAREGVEDGGLEGAGAAGDAVPVVVDDPGLEGEHVGR